MHKITAIIFFILLLSGRTGAQLMPQEGSEVSYRLICYSFPGATGAHYYRVEIAAGNYADDKTFAEHIIRSVKTDANKVIAEVPLFGAVYTWRVTSVYKKRKSAAGSLHHFSTAMAPVADTNLYHFKVIQHAREFKDAYVFLDITKGLYDMEGRLVWYMRKTGDTLLRDLKPGSDGAGLTYVIDDKGVYNINYFEDVLWKNECDGNKDDNDLHYHHEFTQLSNGNYMALGQDFQYWKKHPDIAKGIELQRLSGINAQHNDTAYERTPMGELVEFNKKGEVVWEWKSSEHLGEPDFFFKPLSGGMQAVMAHENSFFFDEKTAYIYISCRNLDKIIKIHYPDGKIARIYDGDAQWRNNKMQQALFCGQHSCKISEEGYLYLYDNNTCDTGMAPKIVVMKEPVTDTGKLQMVWEYDCRTALRNNRGFPSGGNVIALPGQSYFTSMAYPGSAVFIVDKDKNIVWSAVAEKWNAVDKKWEPLNLFRASIIVGKAALGRFILTSAATHAALIAPDGTSK